MQSFLGSGCRLAQAADSFGQFVLVSRLDTDMRREWRAVLADATEVVVSDIQGAPSSLGIEKAASILQHRDYFEERGRRLLVPLTRDPGEWRLVALDFGDKAKLQDCELLMCFAFEAACCELSITSPDVEIGFTLLRSVDKDSIFVLTVTAAAGLSV